MMFFDFHFSLTPDPENTSNFNIAKSGNPVWVGRHKVCAPSKVDVERPTEKIGRNGDEKDPSCDGIDY
jgi:hypothetical protein